MLQQTAIKEYIAEKNIDFQISNKKGRILTLKTVQLFDKREYQSNIIQKTVLSTTLRRFYEDSGYENLCERLFKITTSHKQGIENPTTEYARIVLTTKERGFKFLVFNSKATRFYLNFVQVESF